MRRYDIRFLLPAALATDRTADAAGCATGLHEIATWTPQPGMGKDLMRHLQETEVPRRRSAGAHLLFSLADQAGSAAPGITLIFHGLPETPEPEADHRPFIQASERYRLRATAPILPLA